MKFFKWLESLYVKYHDCDNNMKLYSETFINDYLVEIEYHCSVCGHVEKQHFPERHISKNYYCTMKAVSAISKLQRSKYGN